MISRSIVASPTGNGTGLVVLQVPVDEKSGAIVQINVLPKFWWAAEKGKAAFRSVIDLNSLKASQKYIWNVPEMGTLEVVCNDQRRLSDVVRSLTELRFTESDFGDEPNLSGTNTAAALFLEVPQAPGEIEIDSTSGFDSGATISDFWGIVSQLRGVSELVQPPVFPDQTDSGWENLLAGQIAEEVPQLRDTLRRVFIQSAETFVKSRKPVFVQTSSKASSVRGRIVLATLPSRRAHHDPLVECEHDDLVPDSPWYTLVRLAARAALVEEPDPVWRERLARIDYKLADVSLIGVRELFANIQKSKVPRKLRSNKNCFALSKALLKNEERFGAEDDPVNETAVIASLRVSTAQIFEQLFEARELAPNLRVQKHRESVKIHSHTGATSKTPDLSFKTLNHYLVAFGDCKYKYAPSGFSEMPTGDEYQQYAYSAASGVNAVFIYVSPSPRLIQSTHAVVGARQSQIVLGVCGVRFPVSPDLDAWWLETSAVLGEFLRASSSVDLL